MDLVVVSSERHSGVATLDERVLEGVRRIYEGGTAENTRLAYARDMAYASAWAEARRAGPVVPMSVDAAVLFVVDHVEGLPEDVDAILVSNGAKRDFGPHAISTVRRRVATLSIAHVVAKEPNPFERREIRDLLARARKKVVREGWRPRRKSALYREVLEKMLATCGDDLIGIRDRALLLFGFSSGGRRRSEMTGAVVERLTSVGSSYVYDLGVTKTTQSGEAGRKPVKGRAAEAMTRWLEVSGIESGPLFRAIVRGTEVGGPLQPKAVWKIVRKRAKAAGLDPRDFGGHSIRSGFMTESGLQGVSLADAMALSEHRTVQVALGYYQTGEILRNRGGDLLG